MSEKVWMIVGRLRERNSDSKPDKRIVYLVQDSFPTTEESEEALRHNWSAKPHDVEIIQVSPLNVGETAEQLEVIYNQPGPTEDRVLNYLAWAQSILDQGEPGAIPLPPDLEMTVERRIRERTWEK